MKHLQIVLGFIVLAAVTARAAVIIHSLPQPMEIINNGPSVSIFFPFDVDKNGTTDFSFAVEASSLGLRTERANRLVIKVDPSPDQGGPVASLGASDLISLDSLAQNLKWLSSDIIEGYVSQDELIASIIIQVFFSGHNTQFTTRSAIGIEFEAEDGIHYGYFDISPAPRVARQITLHGWAWETVPGRPILAGQVPEPSAVILVGGATVAFLTRRRRG